MSVRALILVLIAAWIAGCTNVGMTVEDFKPAQGPHGVHMKLKLNGKVVEGDRMEGELLAVRADGILLNAVDGQPNAEATRRVVMIPFWMMKTATIEQMGRAKIKSQGKETDELYLNRLRLVARFPQGLSDELLATLLAEYGQEQVEVPQRLD
jgi:hypothetical protein